MNQKSVHRVIRYKIFLIFILVYATLASAQGEGRDNAKDGRDPFIDLVTPDGRMINLEPSEKETKIVLGGIIYDKNGPSYAIINNQVVRTGDYIAGYSVFRIEQKKVILLKDSKPVEYEIRDED